MQVSVIGLDGAENNIDGLEMQMQLRFCSLENFSLLFSP